MKMDKKIEKKTDKKIDKKIDKKQKRILGVMIAAVVMVIVFYAGMAYINDYYKATETAQKAMLGTDIITVVEEEEYFLLDNPNLEASKGLIFYQGGKVDEKAYAPLMLKCAEAGYEVYLVKMPARLAMLGLNKAESIMDNASHIEEWTMMGHSFGGAMAASFVAGHEGEVDRLVLLAAYSTEDISDMDIEVHSLYGSEDKVLNMESYEKYWSNLPADTVETVIEGGNHGNFGHYGEQEGDGVASISRNEQEECILDILLNY